MNQKRKKIRIFYCMGIVIAGILLGLFSIIFDIKPLQLILAVWLAALVIIICNFLWMGRLNQKLNKVNLILTKERNPDRYINEIEILFKELKYPLFGKMTFPFYAKQIYRINLAAAYCRKREFKTANELLLQINPKGLSGINRNIYYADLALTYFYLNDVQPAISIMEKQKKKFEKCSRSPQFGPIMAVLYIFDEWNRGNKGRARELLCIAQQKWTDGRYLEDFSYLEKMCEETGS